MGVIGAIWPLIEAGRVKVYSCDSVAGRALAAGWGSIEHRCWLMNGFEDYVASEVVPAIRADCGGRDIEVISAGAFNALAVVCRYPHHFRAAIGMSGAYDLESLIGFPGNEDFYFASPYRFVPGLDGPQLDRLRRRFILMAYG